jgi:gamma-glutamylcyclotransferase
VLYFAYASNLDPQQMQERCPGHHVVGLAALHDHRLTFPRFSTHWGGGTASVVHAHGQQVWGVVYEITDDQVAVLDSYEDFRGAGDQHNAYDREMVTVDVVRTDDGSVPRRVRAATYLARASNPQPPSRRYLDTILRGATHHRLPEDYLDALRKTEAGEETSATAAEPEANDEASGS